MKIEIPASLRAFAGNQSSITVHADTVAQAVTTLLDKFPDLKKHLYTPDGLLRSFVNLYLNDEDVRYLPEREETTVKDSDALSIIPSIAGGLGQTGARAFGANANPALSLN
ncbi:MAG TPA: MoaD/ThiS family protein [Acidobacteriaceae bacterium]|jgi:adenylyltransferase/sulfurtransferase|nr:MoaD/ThiS family protein [Acidobacteriaceae bacterium]